MSFNNRSEFTSAAASEKITIAHVEATSRVYNWTLVSGNNYSASVNYFVVDLKNGTTSLTNVASIGALVDNSWFFDSATNTLYANLAGTNPDTVQMVTTFRFFWSSAPVTMSWDLTNSGNHVLYDARIKSAPGFKHKIGIDQKLTSVIGQGSLVLENNDGGLDEIYDKVFFENQSVNVYSWNRDLSFSEAKRIYRGRTTNKTFTPEQVTLKIKDGLFDLLQPVPQTAYDDTDNVNTNIQGRYKRWVYGRVDGLQLQSIDQIGDGYTITGTASGTAESTTITGSGTTFLADTSPGDTILFGTQEFKVSSVTSDTSLEVDNAVDFSFTGLAITLTPEIPTTVKNRDFFVAGHATARLTKTLTEVVQLNRVTLNNTDGLRAGDFVEFTTGERIEIKDVESSTQISLRKNLILIPAVSSDVIRQPIQTLFAESDTILNDDFTIANSSSETTVTLDSDVEFNLARTVAFGFSATFTNGTRSVTTTNDIDLTQVLSPRDYIRPDNVSYSTFYEILAVDTQTITLRTNFADPTITDDAEGKRPAYIGDETIISADVLGRTVDNDPDGVWIESAANAVKDVLTQINVTDINTSSFTTAASENSELISIAIPSSPTGSLETSKSIIDKLTKSTYAALTLDNNLDLQFRNLLPQIDDNITEINDQDVIRWSIESVNGDLIRNTVIRYRHADVDRFTLSAGSQALTYSSEFVEQYIGTNVTEELDIYLYNERSARIMSHREIYVKSLSRATIKVITDLRLEDLEIGDSIVVDFDRMYKRFGDSATRKKVCVIAGKTVTGNRVELILHDFGNIMNRSSIITPNTAPDYSAATSDEKIKYGYITDTSGIVNDEEDTANTRLIS